MPQIVTEPARVAPRSARHAAIFDAVFELLAEVGYDQMSMDAVAARARASKATIYRAWPCKPDLVIDAVMHRFGTSPQAPDTGSLRGDLLALMTRACQLANSADGAVMTGLLTAAARNADLAGTLHECTYRMKHAVHETIINRATARGEVPPGTCPHLLHEVLYSMVLTRRMLAGGPIDEDFAVHVVDDVLMPVLRGARVPDGATAR